ncbi:MAG TPA: hypothetical protein VMH38_07635 [Thermoplasmata archaeon]|nr:hypothetical protein [Thermoplasmata archaeon]
MSDHISWEQRSKTVSTTVREITPEGVKFESNYQGQVSGKFTGMTTGTTVVIAKPDGTSTWEDKLFGMTAKGEMFVAWGKGTGKMTAPGVTVWEGEAQAMSQSPALAWLNNLKFKTTGKADMAKGEAHGQFAETK